MCDTDRITQPELKPVTGDCSETRHGHTTGWQAARPWVKALVCICVLGFLWQPATAQANVIEVTTTEPGINPDGLCSLAEAMENANAGAQLHADCEPGTGADILRLAAGETYSYTMPHNTAFGGNALPPVVADITIEGNGSTLERMGDPLSSFRFFYVTISGTLTLDAVTLVNGDPTTPGGTILLPESGGAVFTHGAVHVRNATLRDNAAYDGGAIYASQATTVTVTNSTLAGNRAANHGGAIASFGTTHIAGSALQGNTALGGEGGALFSTDSGLTVQNTHFSSNESDEAGGALSITAANADVTASLHATEIFSNSARWGGGGVSIQASAGYTAAVNLSHTRLISNHVESGAGGGLLSLAHAAASNGDVAVQSSTSSHPGHAHVTVVDSTIQSNRAASGGGIANAMSNGGGGTQSLTVLRSLIAENTAGEEAAAEVAALSGSGHGGGIYSAGGTLVIANTTLTGNRADGVGGSGGMGGAVANYAQTQDAMAEIVNSTIVSNTASQAGGGLANARAVTLTAQIGVENSLLAFNSATVPNTMTCSRDVPLSIFSRGHNLESGNSCAFDQPSDIVNTDPRIRELADNGGPTLTHALRSASPAIGNAGLAACAAEPVNQRDQRGILRMHIACDIGAYEFTDGKKLMPTVQTVPEPEDPNEESNGEANEDPNEESAD